MVVMKGEWNNCCNASDIGALGRILNETICDLQSETSTSRSTDGEELLRVAAIRGCILHCPFVHVQSVLKLGWYLVLGCQAIVNVDDDGWSMLGHYAAHKIVRVQIPSHETSSVGPDTDRQRTALSRLFWRVESVFDTINVTLLDITSIIWWGNLSHKHCCELVILSSDLFRRASQRHSASSCFLQLQDY